MKTPQRMHKRKGSNVWQWGIKVPSDLRHLYPSQWAHRTSLGTSDAREAAAKAARLDAEWLERFAAQRLSLNPARITVVTPALARAIAAVVRRYVLAADDNMRAFPGGPAALLALHEQREGRVMSLDDAILIAQEQPSGLTDAALVTVARFNTRHAEKVGRDLAGMRLHSVEPLARKAAEELGLDVDWASESGRATLVECLKAYRAGLQEVQRRDAGDIVDTPEPPTLPPVAHEQAQTAPAKAEGHTIWDAFNAWRDDKPGRPEKSIQTYRAAAAKFDAIFPGRTLESLTPTDGRTLVTALLKEAQEKGGNAINTASTVRSRIKTMLAIAEHDGWITKNPLSGRTIDRAQTSREPFTAPDLVKLFDDPLFHAYSLPTDRKAGLDAAYWLPLLGLFTGARITELAQLHTDDLSETEAEGLVLSIQADSEKGQSVKTAQSVRRLPVHSELVRLGFRDYWQAIASHGPGPLFPAIIPDGLNNAGGNPSKWFGAFKKQKGFGRSKTFHSLRHTVHTRLLAIGVPEAHAEAIAGRSGHSEGRRTYLHLSPSDLRPHLERLAYPGLSLPRVFSKPVYVPSPKKRPDASKAGAKQGPGAVAH